MSSEVSNVAVRVRDLAKSYKLYDEPIDRLKEALHPLRKRYHRKFQALAKSTFDVPCGQTLGIIGRNGSGKSTLLKIIAGVVTPSEGNVETRGSVAALLELGTGFNPQLTGRENVYFSGTLLGRSRGQIEDSLADVIAFADIGEFVDQPLKTYSSGMYVRLAFSVAVHQDPTVFLVDEALSVGDVFFQQKCTKYLREDMAHVTKLLVTHDMHAVTSMCDRVMVMDHGEILFDGSPVEAVETYNKLQHVERFGSSQKQQQLAGRTHANSDIPWIEVAPEARSGRGQLQITHVALTSKANSELTVVGPGDPVLLHALFRSSTDPGPLVFGYIVNDRHGSQIFGQNTASMDRAAPVVERDGVYHATYEFTWPGVLPGEYTVTPGIGSGDHPIEHVVQCWAHNVVAIRAINPNTVYCVFDHSIDGFTLEFVRR